jgi:hypothetical protein
MRHYHYYISDRNGTVVAEHELGKEPIVHNAPRAIELIIQDWLRHVVEIKNLQEWIKLTDIQHKFYTENFQDFSVISDSLEQITITSKELQRKVNHSDNGNTDAK